MHLNGRWRIVEMDLWDQEDIDLVEPGFIEFGDDGTGDLSAVAGLCRSDSVWILDRAARARA